MSSLHNDLATWAAKARARGQDTIEIDVETAFKLVDALTAEAPRVLKQVYCDCTCADECPQGRTGSANRCSILVREPR